MNTHDMYGHKIHLLGETGYGVSVSFSQRARRGGTYSDARPYFTIFHVSDGFRQALFGAFVDHDTNRPGICDTFMDRIEKLMATRPHG